MKNFLFTFALGMLPILAGTFISTDEEAHMEKSPVSGTVLTSSELYHANVSLGHNFSVTQFESDYKIVMSYNELFDDYCSCSQTRTVKAAKNSFQSGSNWFTFTASETSGSYDRIVGPGVTEEYYVTTHYTGEQPVISCLTPEDCGTTVNLGGAIYGYTSSIKAPSNVSADDGVDDDRITITWTRNTNIPVGSVGYKVYRDNILIVTLAGTAESYTNTGLSPGDSYTYAVTTYTNSWGGHESSKISDAGSTFTIGLDATDGSKYNVTNLSWNDISDIAEEIRIERSVPNSNDLEELDILSKNATGYNDDSGIPGYSYTYYVTPIGGNFYTDSDNGYSKPNGVIKGHVKSQLAAGVSGVTINVTLDSSIPSGGASLPGSCTNTYCTTTDSEGYYEIKDIYYYEGADFVIVPEKTGLTPHEFSPDTARRSLDVNGKVAAGVDFTDLTVFTVGGTVSYPQSSNGVTCGVKDVSILINGNDFGIQTDALGEWNFAIQDEGDYSFRPVFLHHTFDNGSGVDSTTLFVAADDVSINFTDTQTDSLQIIVQGGCAASLGDSVQVRVTAPDNCFNQTYVTDVNGLLTIQNLPARDYSVEVINIFSQSNNVTNILDQIGNIPVDINLTVRDTAELITEIDSTTYIPEIKDTLSNDSIIIIQPADTIYAGTLDTMRSEVAPKVSFIYRSPLSITADYGGATETTCTSEPNMDPIVLMEQGLSYVITFEVKELLGTDCYIDTGFLKIYDFVSDRGNTAVEVPIKGGFAYYVVDAGEPEIASNPLFHNHEKLLYVIPEVDLIEPVPIEYWFLVTGSKGNTPSFITRTPDIPMLILHDPPGDNSYSYVEEGTSFTNFTTNEYLVGGDAGVFANLILGAKVLTPFSGTGFGTIIKFSAEAGRDNFNRDGIYTTMTFTETFSTSDLDNLTGNAGDVYIGAAYNQEYSLAEQLTFDAQNCTPDVNIVPSLAAQDFATTFVYTEQHIKNTLLPTISFIKDNIIDSMPFNSLSLDDQAEVNNLIADSLMWEQILAENDTARGEDASFVENISFSAGAPITREYETDTTTSVSYEYNVFVNTEFALGAKIDNEAGVWFDSELGVMGKFRWATTTNTGNDTSQTRKVGYVLDDGDIGDFFSVDIKQDESYNVPAFDLKLGTSSCPQEEGTQARDRATIQILPPEITDVPADGAANFICQLTNRSESLEMREYHVRVVSTTNPDGAQVRLGGQLINNGAASFFLPYNETANINLSVSKGPIASNYTDIGIMIYPPCEYELWQDNGSLVNVDTAYIKILNFETECTNVTLRNPVDGWLINQNSPTDLQATFSGYDVNNDMFESLTLQIKKEGEGYIDLTTINKANLVGANYDLFYDMSNFPDGNYRIRAKANCGTGGITYSSEKKGIIDRTSLAPFGIPTPSDGFLRFGGEISVTFDQDIDCSFDQDYQPAVSLVREDTGAPLPFTVQCSGSQNKINIQTNPHLTEINDLKGVLVTAVVDSLRDDNGNYQKYPTEWTFLVNTEPVFWDPDSIHEIRNIGGMHTITATLKNNSLISKAFSLETQDSSAIKLPEWLTPLQTRGTILPNDDYEIEFAVNPDLLPDIYEDTVIALVDEELISLKVVFELLAKEVNWPFDPTQYQYSMTVVTTFSLDDSDTLLTTDTRDLVGAFVNGEIRGVTNVEFVESTNSYIAFLTVYSNDLGGGNGEEISFRFWHALNGVEYGALETLTFTHEDKFGSVSNPLILHPEGIFQVIPLNQGWNWISLNVETVDMSREHVLQSLLGANSGNVITLKSQSATAQYSYGSGWNGNLQNLELGTGYLIHLSTNPDTLKVVGLPSPNPVPVTISGTWTWIGYPRLFPEPVDSVLSGISPSQDDIVKDQYRFSQYETSVLSWEGNLSNLMPGTGYKISLANGGTIIYPASRNDAYQYNPYAFEHNMNITGTFDPSLINETNMEELLIGAFIDGECRGTGEMEYVESIDGYRTFMLVAGNIKDYHKPIEFRILNDISQDEYLCNGETLTFGSDQLIGLVSEPYEFLALTTSVEPVSEEGYSLMQNRPNPAAHETIIPFMVPITEQVVIEIYNISGKRVIQVADQVYDPGLHQVRVDLSRLGEGMYFYQMKTPSYQATKKMLIK